MEIRNITAADVPALLALNNAEAERVNALTEPALKALLASAFAARMTTDGPGEAMAFLIAFDHATPPQGPNHAWFTARESYFAYIDRIVVAPAARGKGVARALYEDVAAIAKAEGTNLLTCEVNLDPPNPESMEFHVKLGFTPCGEAVDRRNGKRVQYLRKPI
jgi:predicted GNAT superfamily acetyltransferase